MPAAVLGSGGTLNVGDGKYLEFTMSTCSLRGTGRVLAPSPSTYPDSPNVVQVERATLIHEGGVADLRNAMVSLSDEWFGLVAVPWAPDLRDADAAYSAHAAALNRHQVRVMQEILWSADEYGGPTRAVLLPHMALTDSFAEDSTAQIIQELMDGGVVFNTGDSLHLTPHGLEVLHRI